MSQISDFLATAQGAGWQDDSPYARGTVKAQVSLDRDSHLLAVTEQKDGRIRWSVTSWDRSHATQAGAAPSVATGCAHALNALRAAVGTLF